MNKFWFTHTVAYHIAGKKKAFTAMGIDLDMYWAKTKANCEKVYTMFIENLKTYKAKYSV